MDVGSELKRARLERSLYIPEVAHKTRIRAEIIQDIERNDFSRCGGEVFARGHVRTIAMALGLDPEPLVAAMGGSTAPTSAPQEEPGVLDVWDLRSRAGGGAASRNRAIVGAVIAVVILAALWYSQANRGEPTLDPSSLPSVTPTGTATVVPEPTPSEEPTDTATATPTDSATVAPTPEPTTVVEAGPLVMRMDCTATAWVRVMSGDTVLFVAIMQPGESKTITSDGPLSIRVGNAAGVRLTVGDTVYATLGASGQIYARTFQPG